MKITILGSGTSSGVPVIGCNCKTCLSNDPRNNRLRSSIYIDLGQKYEDMRYLLIDSGPDFRQQALRYNLPRIDAVLYTHSHADHIFGIDDLRIYNFRQKTDIPIYADNKTGQDLKRIFQYCFIKDPEYEGGGIPSLIFNEISPSKTFKITNHSKQELVIRPLKIFHGKKEILGFRINNFAYLTDCSSVPEETISLLEGIRILILSGLRNRIHKTHFTIMQAIEFAKTTTAKQIYLTHIAHEIEHCQQSKILEELSSVSTQEYKLCYDGLELTID